MNRRILSQVVLVLLPIALLIGSQVGWKSPPPAPVQFAVLGKPTMPFVPNQEFINSTWFCAGVPNGADRGGAVIVANPADDPLIGRLTVFTDADGVGPTEFDFEVTPRDALELNLVGVQNQGTYLSAMVEIKGGGGFVEQRADHPDGSAVSPCSNSTSNEWHFADNYTLNESREDLIITNPFPDDAIVNFQFVSSDGTRDPGTLQGVPVAGHSVYVVNESQLSKDEIVFAVSVVASRGRVVAARAQQYLGQRQGFTLSLGSPSAATGWWFADGDNPPEAYFERFSIYNPSDREAVVQPDFYGLGETGGVTPAELLVPAHRVVSFSITDVPGLPAGQHGSQFISLNDTPIVVERAITRRAGAGYATTVVLGVDLYFIEAGTTRWSMAIGSEQPVDGVLVVLNIGAFDATVAVKTLDAGGEVDVPGLEAVVVPKLGVSRIALPETALRRPLIVVGSQPIIVERLLPRSAALSGRSGSMALPG
ncbi:MAG: hypothetical protein HY826_04100 [Actinobacteria bacterium]|nr:hypothetical protein [Actinomycetota bacterium]